MIAAGTFGLIAYLVGNFVFADYLQLHFVPGVGEVASSARRWSARAWASSGTTPRRPRSSWATSGALALGGGLGAVAVATKHEIVLAIVGGLFVLETVSVIVQVASFKLTGRRVFRMAPDPPPFRAAGLGRADHRDPLLDHRGDAGAARPRHPEAAVGEAGARHDPGPRLRGQEGRRVRPGPHGPRRRARARRRRGRGRGLGREARPPAPPPRPRASRWTTCATADWTTLAALVLSPGVPLTHPDAALDGREGQRRRRRDHRRHRALRPQPSPPRRRTSARRSSPSPAPTASRPPPPSSATSAARPAATCASAATSASASWAWRTCTAARSTCWSCRPTSST